MTNTNIETAYLAGGCFWGVQHYFDQVEGVTNTQVGYCGGLLKNPSYEQVCAGISGHAEAVKIDFDASKLSFSDILKHFFIIHDPTSLNRQGPDVGEQYRSAIFYVTPNQKEVAEKLIASLNNGKFSNKIITQLDKFTEWWPAEDYHQKFAERTGRGMCHITYKPLDKS